jgi:hypothetical protein
VLIFIALNQRLRHLGRKMPRPKFQVHKDGPKRYRVEVPKSLSADRKRRRHFFSTEAKAEAFLRAFKAQLRLRELSTHSQASRQHRRE